MGFPVNAAWLMTPAGLGPGAFAVDDLTATTPSCEASFPVFVSLLWRTEAEAQEASRPPDCFHDLALDGFVAGLIAGREQHALAPLYGAPLVEIEAVRHRQAVVRDLSDEATARVCEAFSDAMQSVRDSFAQADRRRHELQKRRLLLAGLERYCEGLATFAHALGRCSLSSSGLRSLSEFLSALVGSEAFGALRRETEAVAAGLAAVRYDVKVYGGGLRVERHGGGHDQGAEVEALFAKFRQDTPAERSPEPRDAPDLNPVEDVILEFVARLHPELFAHLAALAKGARGAIGATLCRVDRELQFFLAYRDAIAPLRRAGLRFCLPTVTCEKAVSSRDGFDVVLATRLVRDGAPVVTNGFDLAAGERILLVSGPNQGGKTTFARAFGQMHHLASLGLPVPGSAATLHLADAVLTHFEREESVADRRSKLEDDLVRVRDLLGAATSASVIVLNEIFSSTTLDDAVFLAGEVLRRVVALDALCVLVTFLDELVALSPTIVSAVSTVVPDDPARRTFEIVRRPADGRSYALAIAEKHRLTYAALSDRLHF